MTRTHVSGASLVVTIPIGDELNTLSIPGNIFSMAKSDRNSDKSLSTFCPDCQSPIRYKYYCDEGHGPHQRNDLLRGKYVANDKGDQEIVILDEEELVENYETDIARGKLALTPVTRQSLVDGTTPWGNSYHFMPIPGDTADKEAYTIVYSLIADNPDWAFVCRANIGRGAETLLSVEAGAFGGLTLQNLAYPETLYDLPEYDVETLSRPKQKIVRESFEDRVGEFDPSEWYDRQAAVVSEIVKASSGSRKGKAPKTKKIKESAPGLLDAIVANSKAS